MKQRKKFNPKRRLRPALALRQADELARLGQRAGYGGNPEHKRIPGDFGLNPASDPRPAKTLCDEAGILRRAEALALLRQGFERGLVSVQEHNGWPQNVWAVTETGIPLEAQLENQASGTYHGYPMALADPFREEILRRWNTP